MVAAPLIALMTKRATEGVPRVGKVVQKITTSVLVVFIYFLLIPIHDMQGKTCEKDK